MCAFKRTNLFSSFFFFSMLGLSQCQMYVCIFFSCSIFFSSFFSVVVAYRLRIRLVWLHNKVAWYTNIQNTQWKEADRATSKSWKYTHINGRFHTRIIVSYLNFFSLTQNKTANEWTGDKVKKLDKQVELCVSVWKLRVKLYAKWTNKPSQKTNTQDGIHTLHMLFA